MCQMKGRLWNSLQCCAKKPSRSQVARSFPAKPASASSASSRAGDQSPP
jgi:hypothetical protein